jgi:hypothetical protein
MTASRRGWQTHASLLSLPLACSLACSPGRSPAPAEGDRARAAAEPFHFVDVTAEAGLDRVQVCGGSASDHIIETLGCGGAWLDYDGDADPDLYLAQGADRLHPRNGPPDRLWRNDGDVNGDGVPDFTDVTAQARLGDTLWSFGVAAADYDGDGDPDLYVTNWGPDRLYRNEGDGTFTEIGEAAGVADRRWSVSAAWSDVDRDGDLDLYVTNYVEFDFERYPARGQPGRRGEPPCSWHGIEILCGPRNLEPAFDVLYVNEGDPDGDGIPTFRDGTREAGLRTVEPYFGLAALFFDADLDGDDDLYVANDSQLNLYFINRGDGTFQDASMLSGLAYNEQGHEQASMGLAAGDHDGDGLLDLAVTNFSHDHDTLYHNEGQHTFTDVSYPAGIGARSFFNLAWGNAFVDLDHDGREDLFVANGHVYPEVDQRDTGTTFRQRNSLYHNVDGTRFEEIGERAGPGLQLVKTSRALLPADVDGDGDVDLLVTSLDDTPDLLRNDGAPGNWLAVRLQGTRSNRDGLGALVTIEMEGRRQIRQITRNASFCGSTLPVAHFGLGGGSVVERLEVRWPAGGRSVLEHVGANRQLLIRED